MGNEVMSRWSKTVPINDLFRVGEDLTPEGITAFAIALIERLEPHDAPLDCIRIALLDAADFPEHALYAISDGLEEIYDWADLNRIWLGGAP
jgi:hypothetical protein